jgi:hypothetical protein
LDKSGQDHRVQAEGVLADFRHEKDILGWRPLAGTISSSLRRGQGQFEAGHGTGSAIWSWRRDLVMAPNLPFRFPDKPPVLRFFIPKIDEF